MARLAAAFTAIGFFNATSSVRVRGRPRPCADGPEDRQSVEGGEPASTGAAGSEEGTGRVYGTWNSDVGPGTAVAAMLCAARGPWGWRELIRGAEGRDDVRTRLEGKVAARRAPRKSEALRTAVPAQPDCGPHSPQSTSEELSSAFLSPTARDGSHHGLEGRRRCATPTWRMFGQAIWMLEAPRRQSGPKKVSPVTPFIIDPLIIWTTAMRRVWSVVQINMVLISRLIGRLHCPSSSHRTRLSFFTRSHFSCRTRPTSSPRISSHTVHWKVTGCPCQADHSDEATARRRSTFYANVHVHKETFCTPPPRQADVRLISCRGTRTLPQPTTSNMCPEPTVPFN